MQGLRVLEGLPGSGSCFPFDRVMGLRDLGLRLLRPLRGNCSRVPSYSGLWASHGDADQ